MLNSFFPRLGTICPAATSKRRRQRFSDNPSKRNIFSSSLFQMIEEHIEDFLAYLDINRSMFFSSRNSLTHNKKISHLIIFRQKLPGCFVRLSPPLWNWQIAANPSWMEDSTTKGHFRITDTVNEAIYLSFFWWHKKLKINIKSYYVLGNEREPGEKFPHMLSLHFGRLNVRRGHVVSSSQFCLEKKRRLSRCLWNFQGLDSVQWIREMPNVF